ncbi:rhodanese-like domain-containing protein [Brevundimonas sp. TWP2-3-4b2]|uniref:rhodanese-like domain-containing protein n=1 Tax=Brevundimonas sp. TWP2-3-4b2 TaxID=2804595 RepID=UPI003CECE5E9
MTPKPVTPEAAARLVADGAVLIDIREAQECAEVIEGALSAPMSSGASGLEARPGQPVIFHCRTGRRTEMNAEALAASVPTDDVYLLQGGIEGWQAAGLPVCPRD